MLSINMYKHQDPLNKIYTRQLNESGYEDFRAEELGKDGHATEPTLVPGLHLYDFDEVVLKDGSIVPVGAEFTADWENPDYEQVEGRRYQTQSAGFTIRIDKLFIPPNVTEQELAEWTGKPGIYKPGMDVMSLITPKEMEHVNNYLNDHYNETSRWGQTQHYLPDPRDRDDRD